jgi:16S rRNA (guanine966-N2)-methyltransferase
MPRKNGKPLKKDAARPGGGLLLRIIGGAWRGRRIHFPPVEAIRPTPDRVRETLFNWLQMDVAGSRCLDLYAGSGALGLEALSRGAGHVVFVEVDPGAARHLSQTLQDFQCDRGKVVTTDAKHYLAGTCEQFDIIFVDPPYTDHALADICGRIEQGGWLRAGGLAYLEDAAAAGPPVLPPGWTLLKSKRAGAVGYHLARRDPPAAA